MNSNKFLITQTLLSSYGWAFKTENGYNDFLKTLRRTRTPQNQAMLDGIHFENLVTAYAGGAMPEEKHKWHDGILGVGDIVRGGAFQVKLARDVTVNNVKFVLYGILDNLKCGTVYDIKFSKTYHIGKYLDSPQHPMYLELCPEAKKFVYIISNGKDVYKEEYLRENVPSIIPEISEFMDFLDKHNLVRIYTENWQSKY